MLIGNIFENNLLLLFLSLKHKFHKRLIELVGDLHHPPAPLRTSELRQHAFLYLELFELPLQCQVIMLVQKTLTLLNQLGFRVAIRIHHSQSIQLLPLQTFSLLLSELPGQEYQLLIVLQMAGETFGHWFTVQGGHVCVG